MLRVLRELIKIKRLLAYRVGQVNKIWKRSEINLLILSVQNGESLILWNYFKTFKSKDNYLT